MPIRSAAITVGTSAVALTSNSSVTAQGSVLIHNRGGAGSGILFVGDAQVTTASGLAIASNTYQQIYVGGNGQLYGISQEASQTVRVVEVV